MIYLLLLVISALKFFQIIPMDISWITILIFFAFQTQREYDHSIILGDIQTLFKNTNILTKEANKTNNKIEKVTKE
jgi:hypothetical protein